jgi:hypothetical protein
MASIYDKASLVMIPSGSKEGKLYSQKPTNGDGDFTFSRSTAATRVNASGNIEKETGNLLVQSNQFDTTWAIGGTGSIVGGQSDKDGGSDAWLLSKTAAWSYLSQSTTQSGVNTFSVYAKANASSYMLMRVSGGSNPIVYFNLSSGAVSLEVNNIEASIESIGSGWYRCSIVTNVSITDVRIYPAEANTAGAASGSVYIQDAQLEQGLVARNVITTTTSAIYGGITDNVPRLDYTDSSCPALLLEPQRTNVFDYSEYASGNSSANAPTLVDNYAVSPEGYQNAFQISTDAGTFRRVRKILTGLSGNTSYSMSIFVKKATSAISTYGGLGMVWQGGTQKVNYIIFDEYNGTMSILQDQTGNTSTKVDDVGGYWRFSVSATDTGSNTSFEAAYYACLSATGSTIGVGVKTWVGYGFQLEAGSYATSYIPTYGSAVTRVKDFTQMSLSSFDLTGSFSMHYHFGKTQKLQTASSSFAHYNTDTNDFFLYTNSSGNDGLNIYMDGPNGGYVFGSGQNDAWSTDESKICITYDATTGRLAYFINGVKFNEQTNFLSFGDAVSNPNFQGDENIVNINRYLFFTQALTDQEAIDLTTL